MATATKGVKMAREIKAKFSKGKFEPLESVDGLKEGTDVIVSVPEEPFSDAEWEDLTRYAERTAKEAGITSEEQVNEMIYEQRHRNSQA